MSADEVLEGLVEIDAWFCSWRSFGIGREFSNRPPEGWSTKSQVGPGRDDVITLTIGDIPVHLIESIRTSRALGMFFLESFVGQHGQKTSEELERHIEGLMTPQEKVKAELIGKFPTILTVELARPRRVLAVANARFRWLADASGTVEVLDEFAEEANNFLDLALVRLLPSLGETLRIDRLLKGDRLAYVGAEGKAAFTPPNLKFSANGYGSGNWSDLPFEELAEGLADVPNSVQFKNLILSASRWLWTALSVEKDPLRRFQFAFLGLELLANKVGKHVEESVVADLSNELDLPFKDLVWPAPRDADSPWRNLTFRFALLATRVTRETAAADIATFKDLAKERNQLAHGNATEEDMEDLPAWRAIDLLRRYLSLVSAAEARGELTNP